jgi:hypothetical protein
VSSPRQNFSTFEIIGKMCPIHLEYYVLSYVLERILSSKPEITSYFLSFMEKGALFT